MMLTIGRTVSGANTMRVSNNVVSGTHCKIFLDEKSNIMYIEDLGSTNGTYVNGVQVMRYALKVDDNILLGGDGGYKTTLREVLKYVEAQQAATHSLDDNAQNKQGVAAERTYVEEFAKLKDIYDSYQHDTLEIKDKLNSVMMWRIIPSSIVAVITAAIPFVIDAPEVKRFMTLGSALLTLIILLICFKVTAKMSHKYNAALLKRQEDFQLSYVCPKCRSDFGNRSWVALHHKGFCPACKAKFKVGS
ncbi:MAG: FHA domain-containing protein [Alistipes sp.]|nr:FHA domain-containing protein [Alistipes sp.]